MGFKVGDNVRVAPSTRYGWNSDGLMENTVGRIGVVKGIVGKSVRVFFPNYAHPFGPDAVWAYVAEDLEKAVTFKGNK